MSRNFLLKISLTIALVLQVYALPAQADTVTLWASEDGTLYEEPGSSTLTTGASTLYASNQDWNNGGSRARIYIEIPIDPLLKLGSKEPPMMLVTGATLQLNSLGFSTFTPSDNGLAYAFHMIPGGGTATGNLAADNPQLWFSDFCSTIYNSNYSAPWNGEAGPLKVIDLLAGIQFDIYEQRGYSLFMIDCDSGSFGSISASGSVGNGPQLYVEFTSPVPLPGAFWLLGSGLLGLCLLRGRRK